MIRFIIASLMLCSACFGQVDFGSGSSGISLTGISSSSGQYTYAFWFDPNGNSVDEGQYLCDFSAGRLLFVFNGDGAAAGYAAFWDTSYHVLFATPEDKGFMVLTYDGINGRSAGYLDAELQGTNTASFKNLGGAAFLGARYNGLYPYKGFLTDFRIYQRILSASEISEIYDHPWSLTDDPDLVLRTCIVTNDTGDTLTGVAPNYGTGTDGTYSNAPTAAPWTIQTRKPRRATINID